MNILVKLPLADTWIQPLPPRPASEYACCMQFAKSRTCTRPQGLLLSLVFQFFCKNTNSESGELQFVFLTVNAQDLPLCSSALFTPCSSLAGGRDWELLCFQDSEEAWLTQRETATVWAGTHPTGGPHCSPGWRWRWWREGLQGGKGEETL